MTWFKASRNFLFKFTNPLASLLPTMLIGIRNGWLARSRVYSLESTAYSRQSTVDSLQSTVYSQQSTVYSLHSTVDSRQSTVYSQQSTFFEMRYLVLNQPMLLWDDVGFEVSSSSSRLSFLTFIQAFFTKKPKKIYFVNPDSIWLQTILWKIR